jgi:hypothetical protein
VTARKIRLPCAHEIPIRTSSTEALLTYSRPYGRQKFHLSEIIQLPIKVQSMNVSFNIFPSTTRISRFGRWLAWGHHACFPNLCNGMTQQKYLIAASLMGSIWRCGSFINKDKAPCVFALKVFICARQSHKHPMKALSR